MAIEKTKVSFEEALNIIRQFLSKVDPGEINIIDMDVTKTRYNKRYDKEFITVRIERKIEGE